MKKNYKKLFQVTLISVLLCGIAYLIIFSMPVRRVGITAELIMLGDLDDNKKWDENDKETLEKILKEPFLSNDLTLFKMDVNGNHLIDEEDIQILNRLYENGDPYKAQQVARAINKDFPWPRELFKYLPKYEYVQKPLFTLNHDIVASSPFGFLKTIRPNQGNLFYNERLSCEIYDEAVRFSIAYAKRKDGLSDIEKNYVQQKIQACNALFDKKESYELLLSLIGLVEDVETLTTKTQDPFIQKILYFRDHLRSMLVSEQFSQFNKGAIPCADILHAIEKYLQDDLAMTVDIASLKSPRDFLKIENYVDRAEWQKNKNKATKADFEKLILYAQYDHRYLRAVSKTTRKYEDTILENHNLPMILLYREALRIKQNDKKAAAGLLDETIRIPLEWVKSIPRNMLPSSVALENFLLPGNKEDGSDKSRHWNVFGAIALYKSPQESLMLALKRESKDLKEQNYSPDGMREFIRDTISNINGIYYVMSINPNLIKSF